jgi:hypothetical protein
MKIYIPLVAANILVIVFAPGLFTGLGICTVGLVLSIGMLAADTGSKRRKI